MQSHGLAISILSDFVALYIEAIRCFIFKKSLKSIITTPNIRNREGKKLFFFFFLRACYLPMCWVFSLMFLIHKAILRDKFYYYLILWMRKMKPPKRTNDLSWAPQIASGKVRAHTQSFLALKHKTILYFIGFYK